MKRLEMNRKRLKVKKKEFRYGGEVGDVVIGRVTDVQQKRWKLDVNGRLDANLPLSSVNLPGGELRKKSLEVHLKKFSRKYASFYLFIF